MLIYNLNTLRGINALEVTDSVPPAPRRGIADISWDGTWDFIAAASRDGEMYVVNLATSEVTTVLNVGGQLNAIDWNPQTNEILYAGVSESGQPILSMVDVSGIGGVPLPPPTCDTTIPTADVPALISAITAANSAGSPQTICLEEGTYALTAVQHNADGPNGLPAISGDVTLLGLGSGVVIQRDSSAPKFRILRVTSASRYQDPA